MFEVEQDILAQEYETLDQASEESRLSFESLVPDVEQGL